MPDTFLIVADGSLASTLTESIAHDLDLPMAQIEPADTIALAKLLVILAPEHFPDYETAAKAFEPCWDQEEAVDDEDDPLENASDIVHRVSQQAVDTFGALTPGMRSQAIERWIEIDDFQRWWKPTASDLEVRLQIIQELASQAIEQQLCLFTLDTL
jgi:hypothetical protein